MPHSFCLWSWGGGEAGGLALSSSRLAGWVQQTGKGLPIFPGNKSVLSLHSVLGGTALEFCAWSLPRRYFRAPEDSALPFLVKGTESSLLFEVKT